MRFLQTISLEWLIQGHITEEKALNIVNRCEEQLNFKNGDPYLVRVDRCMKLNSNTAWELSDVNIDENANSACRSVFQGFHQINEFYKACCLDVLSVLLKEQFFN